jgi:hypothetical protein
MPTPHDSFQKTMKRMSGLLLLHPQLHGVRGRPAQHVADVLRGALVLGVGALDALVLDSVIAAIPDAARAGRLGPNVAKWVKEDADRFLVALASEDPTDHVALICRDHLGNTTFQRAAAIEGVLRNVVRADPPWGFASAVLNAGRAPDEPEMTAEAVRVELDEFVERRHRIAHSGDLRPDGTTARPIQLTYVKRARKVIWSVGEGVTAMIEKSSRSG